MEESSERTPLLVAKESNNIQDQTCNNSNSIQQCDDAGRTASGSESPETTESSVSVSNSFSRQQKLTLAAFIIVNFTSTLCYSLIAPFFPDEASQKGASDTLIGLIFGLHEFVIFVSSPIYGRYITKIGSKFMFFAGIFVCGGSTVLFGFLNQIPRGTEFLVFCFVLRTIEALGASAFITASLAIVANMFPDNVGTTFGLLETFNGLGMVSGPPLGGLLYNLGGYRLPFLITGCFLIAILPFTIWLLPAQDDSPKTNKTGSVWKMLLIPDVLLTMVVLLVVASSICFLDPSLQPFLQSTFSLTPLYVGIMFMCVSLTYTIIAPLFGYVADKRPKWALTLMAIGSGISAVSYLIMAPSPLLNSEPAVWLTALSLVVLGIGCGVLSMPTFKLSFSAVIAHGYPDDMETNGMVSGLVNSGFSLGAFLGPTVGGGAVLEVIGFGWTTSLLAALNASVLVTVLGFVVWRRVTGRGRGETEGGTSAAPHV